MSNPEPHPTASHGREPLDVGRLSEYLRKNVDRFDADCDLVRLKGGQSNPTYLLTSGSMRYVLRKKPVGHLLSSAHAIDREHRVISALRNTGVPVPRTLCLCEDSGVIGTPFYVMEYVDGIVLWDPTLPGMRKSQRTDVYDEMCRVIAALHSLEPDELGLSDYGRGGSYVQRQIERWSKQYFASRAQPIEAMERLVEWLRLQRPSRERTSLVHGDLRIDNFIFDRNKPRILAVLDWELSTLGDPLADFAYHMLSWHLTSRQFRGMAEFDLESLGIPSAEAHLAAYAARTGRELVDAEDWDYYLIFNMFRLVAILQGIADRVEEGTATSDDALETSRHVRPIAELAWRRATQRLGAR